MTSLTNVYGVYDTNMQLSGVFTSSNSLIKLQEEHGGTFVSNFGETGKTALKMYGSFRVKNAFMHVYVNPGYYVIEV